MKKSIFSRIFSINIVTVIAGLLILAITQYIIVSQFIYRERVNNLKDNAHSIAGFIESGTAPEQLESFLYGFSRSTGTGILIIDHTGKILLASSPEDIFNKGAKRIDKKYTEEVFSNRENVLHGTLGGIYNTEMFTLQVPIVSAAKNAVLGAILISTTTPEMERMQSYLGRMMLISLILVLLISFILSFALSRHISKPIKSIGIAAKSFAQGDFSSRVEINEKHGKIEEIDELTRSFNDMAYSIEQSDSIRNNFISDVSHELRTPMTTIGGFVDGILDETIPQERQRDYLLIVKEEISRLSALVNSFLNITRLQTGNQALEISNFDINEIIRRTLVGFENKIEEKNIQVNVDLETESCLVTADMNQIRQVLTNLLENAIKFTHIGGMLKISVTQRNQEAVISVYNTGCGIAEKEQKLIFERFYKADKSRSLNKNGTGIGLFIVKDILNRHKKSITVKSREGEFAEFTFTLDKAKL